MRSISLAELYELYKDTISKCGSYLLNESDNVIIYNIFEEFDVGIISFLHEESLIKLFDGGYISADKMKISLELRNFVLEMQNSGDWNIESFRASEKWKKVLYLSDKLVNMH